MRKTIIAANWKMNLTRPQALELVDGIKGIKTQREIIICPPFTLLEAVSHALFGTEIRLGAQNMYHKEAGAYTGEIAPSMLLDFGVSHVIVGHSERRGYFGETDETVRAKVVTALAHGITPILCVGESLDIREAGKAVAFVTSQVQAALDGAFGDVIIAYEPIWAIGTGKTPTPLEAQEMCAAIRAEMDRQSGRGEQTSILYGGSMNGDNAAGLLAQPDIDGGLIGGASLKAETFARLL